MATPSEPSGKIDFFICHASEDKISFVRDLFAHLAKHGAVVFYDEYSIKLGDSITASINKGLGQCDNAIIVLSKHFFEKNWTQSEMHAVFARAQRDPVRILIVLHEIEHSEVARRYPLLADLKAISSNVGIPEVCCQIFQATGFRSKIGYITAELGSHRFADGFGLVIRVQLHAMGDPFVEKCIFEAGSHIPLGARVSLRIVRNERIAFSVSDNLGRTVQISADCAPIRLHPCVVVGMLSPSRRSLELFFSGKLIAEFNEIPISFFDDVSFTGGMVIFNSLDLNHPCSALLSGYAITKDLLKDEVETITFAFERFNNGLGR